MIDARKFIYRRPFATHGPQSLPGPFGPQLPAVKLNTDHSTFTTTAHKREIHESNVLRQKAFNIIYGRRK